MEKFITSRNDKTGLGFSSQTIFRTALLTVALETLSVMGVGWRIPSFSFAFTNNHIEA